MNLFVQIEIKMLGFLVNELQTEKFISSTSQIVNEVLSSHLAMNFGNSFFFKNKMENIICSCNKNNFFRFW